MTDREKAIIMAYTGITMLTGDKFSIFHKYIEDILGRSVWTHELADHDVWKEIKEKSENDFLALCEDEPDDRWIPVNERLPEYRHAVLVYCPENENVYCAFHDDKHWCVFGSYETVWQRVTHWRPLPQKPEESEDEE